ncbi:MAG: hypothetical protein JNK15_15505 [Planctomycetes bacterium]|nr:hypothetical protein [Planctomycetota bacterium]
MRFPTSFSIGLCCAAASLPSQNFLTLPATAGPATELGSYSLLPFMQPNARVQVFYDALEVAAGPVVLDQLELRYDGPIPAVGAPGPFSITRLQIKVGVSTVTTPTADFAANLTTPLVTVFDGPWTYLPDPGSAYPHPWGGPSGALTFPFTTTVPLALAQGEWLVVEIAMEGNNIANFGFSHAIVDGATTSGGFANGSTANYGQGCAAAAAAPDATASVSGLYGPGGVHRLAGANLGANAAALAVFGLSNSTAFVPLPWTLPGTNCTLLASPDVAVLTFADAAGSVAGPQAVPLALPADPAFSGLVVYEQFASLVPTANPWGIVLSNGVAVTLGSWTPLGRGTFLAAHDTDATAPHANSLRAFGYAMRLRTL